MRFGRVGMGGRIFLGISAALALTSGAAAVEDMAAGKTPAQLFASDCSECHRNPAGLAKGRDVATLASFLGEHYTTKSEYARAVAAYVAGFVVSPPPSRARRDTGSAVVSEEGHPGGADKQQPRPPGAVAGTRGREDTREAVSRTGAAAADRRSEATSPLQAIGTYLGSMLSSGGTKAAGGTKVAAKARHLKPHRHPQDIAEPQSKPAQESKIAAEPPPAAPSANSAEPLAAPPPGGNANAEPSASSPRRLLHRHPRK
jgi:hypothetical protein